jgi:hypothetical protein
MGLSIVEQPYEWTLRGQKLLYRISSTNVSQDGFKYGVSVTDIATGKVYTFFVDRSPSTNDLLFDLAPVVKMFNDESTPDLHTAPADNPWDEPLGGSWKSFTIQFSEWWLVGGVLEDNQEYLNVAAFILNGYYQPFDGYKPSVDGAGNTQLALGSNSSRTWSDRFPDTHTWFNSPIGLPISKTRTYIPCFGTDYGLMYVPLKTTLAGNAGAMKIVMFTTAGGAPATHEIPLTGNEVIGCGVYPMNINDAGSFPNSVKPAMNPNWIYYAIIFSANVGGLPRTITYNFYNAEKYGQFDCRYDYVRLAWVSSRSGWDYANFIKKNEVSNEFERKQYKKLLTNKFGTFNNWQRQLTDRQTIVTQTLTITSDWIQENEFVFLRGLFASNQVELIDTTSDKSLGYRKPVSIIDTSFVEKKERNGKLYNITIKLKYSQDYWT